MTAVNNTATQTSLYWHDYETFGINPKWDRPAQFAGIRTDLDLNVIGEPLTLYCKPAADMLPQPESCLITGISPQIALKRGVSEADFFQKINQQFTLPGTCVVGYNNIRFDGEFTRYGYYRNFIDPYLHEWANGNSRWDIIDMLRLTFALRPEHIEWPQHENGTTSFKLEHLTAANGIEHGAAHDALSDVLATIELAKLVRQRKPKLYHFIFNHRDKHSVFSQLDPMQARLQVHVSSKYPAKKGCMAIIAPLAMHPSNKNGVIVYDLAQDPTPLLDLSVEQIKENLFSATEHSKAGPERIRLKTVHLNRCPVVVPLNTLTADIKQRWQINLADCKKHLELLKKVDQLPQKLQAIFEQGEFDGPTDVDGLLYNGFFSRSDRGLMDQVSLLPPNKLAALSKKFKDPRLPELLFRYRARNYPESLSNPESQRWQAYCQDRFHGRIIASISLPTYIDKLSALKEQADPTKIGVLQALETHLQGLGRDIYTG